MNEFQCCILPSFPPNVVAIAAFSIEARLTILEDSEQHRGLGRRHAHGGPHGLAAHRMPSAIRLERDQLPRSASNGCRRISSAGRQSCSTSPASTVPQQSSAQRDPPLNLQVPPQCFTDTDSQPCVRNPGGRAHQATVRADRHGEWLGGFTVRSPFALTDKAPPPAPSRRQKLSNMGDRETTLGSLIV